MPKAPAPTTKRIPVPQDKAPTAKRVPPKPPVVTTPSKTVSAPEKVASEIKNRKAAAPKKAPVEKKPFVGGRCPCTCGEQLLSPTSKFRQGHDQRWVSIAAGDLVTGGTGVGLLDKTMVDEDMETTIIAAVAAASERYSDGLAGKLDSAARRAWEKQNKKASASEKKTETTPRNRAKKAPVVTPETPEISVPEQTPETTPVETSATDEVKPGVTVRVWVGVGKNKKVKDMIVHGMSQAGKVTAVRHPDSDKVITRGFSLVG